MEACERSRNVREWARQSQLAPGIEAGRRFVALAAKHVGDFWDLASGYDREGSFPVENFADLTASRAIAATVPAEVGGLGLTSLYDTISSCWTRCGRPRCADRRLAGGEQHLPPHQSLRCLTPVEFARRWRRRTKPESHIGWTDERPTQGVAK